MSKTKMTINQSKIKISAGDRTLNTVFYIFVFLFATLCLIPFLVVIGSSFETETLLLKEGYTIIPRDFSMEAYKLVVEDGNIPQAYLITIFTTVAGTALSMLVTCGVAYAMSVKNFRIRGKIAFFIYFTMLFNGGLVSTYLLIKSYLHLDNSIWVLLLPSM